jgi:thiamine pyrophosphokinase
MHTLIVANAPDLDLAPYRERIDRADLLIAADGGAAALLKIDIIPHILIGDLDSVSGAQVAALSARGVEVRRVPREKDETDLELALLLAAERGATQIDMLGALGGRWDHTLANIWMLAMPELVGRTIQLIAERQILFLVRDSAELHGAHGDTVSLLPLTPTVEGVTTAGLLYPLTDATLRADRARGVSNVLIAPPGRVSVRSGLLLVVQHDDGGEYQYRFNQT